MKILTIIVSYNFEKWIERCLGSLKASSHPTDIIVIDNCSNDRTVEIIKTQYTYVRLIENHANLGFGKANNIGMQLALREGYDAVFLLNQDAWIGSDTLATLAEQGDLEEFQKLNGMECCECGCCSYVCPAKRHLTQTIAGTRKAILANRKK